MTPPITSRTQVTPKTPDTQGQSLLFGSAPGSDLSTIPYSSAHVSRSSSGQSQDSDNDDNKSILFRKLSFSSDDSIQFTTEPKANVLQWHIDNIASLTSCSSAIKYVNQQDKEIICNPHILVAILNKADTKEAFNLIEKLPSPFKYYPEIQQVLASKITNFADSNASKITSFNDSNRFLSTFGSKTDRTAAMKLLRFVRHSSITYNMARDWVAKLPKDMQQSLDVQIIMINKSPSYKVALLYLLGSLPAPSEKKVILLDRTKHAATDAATTIDVKTLISLATNLPEVTKNSPEVIAALVNLCGSKHPSFNVQSALVALMPTATQKDQCVRDAIRTLPKLIDA